MVLLQLNTCSTCDPGQQSHSVSDVPPFCQACPSPAQHTDCPVRSASPQPHGHLLGHSSAQRHRGQPCSALLFLRGKGSWAEHPIDSSEQQSAEPGQHSSSQQGSSGASRDRTTSHLRGLLPGRERRAREKPGGEGTAEHPGQEAEKELSNSPGRFWRVLQQKGHEGAAEINL